MIQWLKLDTIADFGLLIMINGSDHEVGAHFNKMKKGMMGVGNGIKKTAYNSESPLLSIFVFIEFEQVSTSQPLLPIPIKIRLLSIVWR